MDAGVRRASIVMGTLGAVFATIYAVGWLTGHNEEARSVAQLFLGLMLMYQCQGFSETSEHRPQKLFAFAVGLLLVLLSAIALLSPREANAQTWIEQDVLPQGSVRSVGGDTVTITQSDEPPPGLGIASSVTLTLSGASLAGCSAVDIDAQCTAAVGVAGTGATAYCVAGSWISQQLGAGSKTESAHLTLSPPYGDLVSAVDLFGHMTGSAALSLHLVGTGCELKNLSTSLGGHRMSQAVKDAWSKYENVAVAVGIATGIAAKGARMIPTPQGVMASELLDLLATFAGFNAAISYLVLKNDPYENYGVVFVPHPKRFATGDFGITKPAYLRVLNSESAIYYWQLGLYHAINRANSAQQDGNAAAEKLQQDAISNYYLPRLGQLYAANAQRRQEAAAVLPAIPAVDEGPALARMAKRVQALGTQLGISQNIIDLAVQLLEAEQPTPGIQPIAEPQLLGVEGDLAAMLVP